MKILAVIPARGGSKGIPRKNVRLMKGKPLIYYAISHSLQCSAITDTVVTSDDDEIKRIAHLYGAQIINRDKSLAQDATTLDPVIYDAVLQMEARKGYTYDIVITLQPTSPLLHEKTLEKALEDFILSDIDTFISGTNKPHLAWTKKDGNYIPLYEKRLNRQMLPPNYLEAGAFVISKRENVKENSRMGDRISIYEIPEQEAIDIDSVGDWLICEAELSKKKIVFRTDGYKLIGMGHIYRCISIAQSLMGHDIMFVLKAEYLEGIHKIQEMFLPMTIVTDDEEFYKFLENNQPDVIVNDCLDTNLHYMQELKNRVNRVVTIEDLGEGSKLADAVINALYHNDAPAKNQYFGERYICLRDEFLIAEEMQDRMLHEKQLESKAGDKEATINACLEVLVIFGGADPANLTKRVYEIVKTIGNNKKLNQHYTIITGPAYDASLHGIVTNEELKITVISDVKRISDYMIKADMAITSQGRTVYELASIGVPAIVLAQNKREQLHGFACMENGFLNLGLGEQVSDETIKSTLFWLLDTPEIRYEMSRLQRQHNLKAGISRVKQIILGDSLE